MLVAQAPEACSIELISGQSRLGESHRNDVTVSWYNKSLTSWLVFSSTSSWKKPGITDPLWSESRTESVMQKAFPCYALPISVCVCVSLLGNPWCRCALWALTPGLLLGVQSPQPLSRDYRSRTCPVWWPGPHSGGLRHWESLLRHESGDGRAESAALLAGLPRLPRLHARQVGRGELAPVSNIALIAMHGLNEGHIAQVSGRGQRLLQRRRRRRSRYRGLS